MISNLLCHASNLTVDRFLYRHYLLYSDDLFTSFLANYFNVFVQHNPSYSCFLEVCGAQW